MMQLDLHNICWNNQAKWRWGMISCLSLYELKDTTLADFFSKDIALDDT